MTAPTKQGPPSNVRKLQFPSVTNRDREDTRDFRYAEREHERQRSSILSFSDNQRVVILKHWDELPAPLFILAPPRSFTSLACAMLGQHPQLYGFPETHLFCDETIGARAERVTRAPYPMADGLLRAVAQLYFGDQTELSIRRARRWLRLRSDLTTDIIFKVLAERVFPRAVVDKSPSTVYNREVLERVHRKFPQARFIHLLRHPRAHGASVMRYFEERAKYGPIPLSHWLFQITSYPPPHAHAENRQDGFTLDPQNGWYALNSNICQFLASVPADRQMRVQGEELLAKPEKIVREIAAWLGLRSDTEAIAETTHPERSPYAFLGPPGARYGNDPFFLADPALRPSRATPQSLEGPLSWRIDGLGFCPEVKFLAREFGYQ